MRAPNDDLRLVPSLTASPVDSHTPVNPSDSSMSPATVPSERLDTLCLVLVSGVGPLTRRALLQRFGSASAVLDARPSKLMEVPGVGATLSRRIASARREIDVVDELRVCAEHGLRVVLEQDDEYPERLRQIPDPPGTLFLSGDLRDADVLSIAIVGTRHATQYGLQTAERLAYGLSQAGYTIVSGLARGIDAVAHRAALAAKGRTIAVLGSGILNLYPPEHAELARDIATCGAVLSEVPPRMAAQAGMFPQRNRVITGLSLGVVVVEAAGRSGALVSARHALEQGREVYAVPGRIDSRMSRGCHQLIKDGATLVESVDDVLEQLGPLTGIAHASDGREIRHAAELLLNEQEQTVLAAIDLGPTLIDTVVTRSQLAAPRVLATITVLEMRRLIRRLSGSTVCRSP